MAEHADLDGIHVLSGERRLHLIRDHLRINGYEAVAPVVVRVKGYDAGERSHAVNTQLLERLEIHLKSSAARSF